MYKYYDNRELSWLKFNKRVLEEARDSCVPLLERLNFLNIFKTNLDEFFMVRVGSLYGQLMMKEKIKENKTNLTSEEQIKLIFKEVRRLSKQAEEVYTDLMKRVARQGVKIVEFSSVRGAQLSAMTEYFHSALRPFLSPQTVGKKQPFPFFGGKEIFAVALMQSKNGNRRIGIVPCTNVLSRLVKLPESENSYVTVENVILHYMPEIFKKYTIISSALVRVTRSAELDAEEALYESITDVDDYAEEMTELLQRRNRLAPVRVELSNCVEQELVYELCHYLDANENQIFYSFMPMDLSFISEIKNQLRGNPKLVYNRLVPQKSASVDEKRPMLEQIEEGDILLSYPYESIRPFLNMLYEASEDPDVVSIKMTLYRLASNSKIVDALCEAAENGKDVSVLVELKARFDEESNIEWSRMLEDAGCRVIYGLEGYKVHSKLCLITKRENNKVKYITQIGTGNYNEKTSELYTDLSLMTADTEIGADAAKVFDTLFLGETVAKGDVKHLLVAPDCFLDNILELIDQEIAKGSNGYIGIKINSLTSKDVIDKLVEASKAGVKTELVIRGISCLVSGMKGCSENITIRSIVGRYLEHSRIFIFGKDADAKVYIGSADFMTRNLLRRVEVAAPVYSKDIKKRVTEIFNLLLKDNVKARIMQPDAAYKKQETKRGAKKINSQELSFKKAYDAVKK
ncbi:MAG: polyphosphate kinase 1 [Clostridiales bacterium]|nr:polyphosphate kinase 1 [Clostridiales bacterium]